MYYYKHILKREWCIDLVETLITGWLEELSSWLRKQVFLAFEQMSEDSDMAPKEKPPRPLNVDVTCRAIMDSVPTGDCLPLYYILSNFIPVTGRQRCLLLMCNP
jgi:hypothetical protein